MNANGIGHVLLLTAKIATSVEIGLAMRMFGSPG
jgi:hypothetical protein